MLATPELTESPPGRTQRLIGFGRQLHKKYARVFWALHSVWALASGVAVLVLAHNRYGFVRWAVLFLALTWVSTLFFSHITVDNDSRAMRFAQGVVSYVTRVMYQETLFFLIPFYFYSTTFPSWNSMYVILLAALAVLSCFDILFDRLLRESRAFAMGFFAFVSYSALLFFFPILLQTRLHNAAYLAGAISFVAAISLTDIRSELRKPRAIAVLVLAFVATLGVVRAIRIFTPPVPLRLTRVRVSSTIERDSLRAKDDLKDVIPMSRLGRGRLYATATVFSPSRLPATVQVRFVSNGEVLRTSRSADVVAHPGGFRVWDSVRAGKGGFKPGVYHVEIWTGDGQLVGRRSVRLVQN